MSVGETWPDRTIFPCRPGLQASSALKSGIIDGLHRSVSTASRVPASARRGILGAFDSFITPLHKQVGQRQVFRNAGRE
jgi:hypothetical protein